MIVRKHADFIHLSQRRQLRTCRRSIVLCEAKIVALSSQPLIENWRFLRGD